MEIIVHLEIGKKVHKNNGIEECGTKKKWFVRLRDELTVKKRHFAQQAEETCVRFQISYSSQHVISAEHNIHSGTSQWSPCAVSYLHAISFSQFW